MKDISTKKIIMTNEAGTGFRVRFLAVMRAVSAQKTAKQGIMLQLAKMTNPLVLTPPKLVAFCNENSVASKSRTFEIQTKIFRIPPLVWLLTMTLILI